MNRIIALLLFMAMQIPLMNQWSAVAYYRVNRDFIAKNLCVNRDKPMLNCNGQCYLSKQLKAAEDKEQKSNSERLNKMPEVVLSFQSILGKKEVDTKTIHDTLLLPPFEFK